MLPTDRADWLNGADGGIQFASETSRAHADGTVTRRVRSSSVNVLVAWACCHAAYPPRPPATISTSASTAAGHQGRRFGGTGAGRSSSEGTSDGLLPGWVSSGSTGSQRAGSDPIPDSPRASPSAAT